MHPRLALLLLLLGIATTAFSQEPWEGRTLISPFNSDVTSLLDMNGDVIQSWTGTGRVSSMAFLLEEGVILRPSEDPDGQFGAAAAGGHFQIIGPEDELIWDYYFSTYEYQQHHDIQPMPNGNVLVVAWERKTEAEAEAMGRLGLNGEMWPTLIAEIEPQGPTGGEVVWEWHLWDHMIQDVDPAKPNYGVVADHPELMDINAANVSQDGDWIHVNSIDYDPVRDEIIFGARASREIYVIDHSTSTEEAAGHTGGNRGKGGDFLYRWGNPQHYDRGDASDQFFDVVHGANLIDEGMPGEGNILVFDNGPNGTMTDSKVVEITPPIDGEGNYIIESGQPFGPATPTWSYGDNGEFQSGGTQCGAFRMPNGNTLICVTQGGYLFEVTESGEVVWEYTHGSNIARALRYGEETSSVDDPSAPAFELLGCYPNPFNPKVTVSFSALVEGRVSVSVHSVDGRRVAGLADRIFSTGLHELNWNGMDQEGQSLPSGVYLIRMHAESFTTMDRVVLLK